MQNKKCKICDVEKTEEGQFHKHHIVPKSEGGKDIPSNLIEICDDCHFRIHHPEKIDGDIDQFDGEFNDAIERDIFSLGWGILPRRVMIDKAITPFAKLLYVELSSLCAERGYCWASNAYLAEKFTVNVKTISRAISELEKYVVIRNRSSNRRRIWIHQLGHYSPPTRTKMSRFIDKNVSQNNTTNNINKDSVLFDEFWKEYPNRKRDREKCLEKFQSFKEDLQQKILDDVKLRKVRHSDWVKNDHQFVPAPLVYLRNKRWEEPIDNKGSGIKNVYHNSESNAVSKIKEKMASRT